jgi:hypothetical protein
MDGLMVVLAFGLVVFGIVPQGGAQGEDRPTVTRLACKCKGEYHEYPVTCVQSSMLIVLCCKRPAHQLSTPLWAAAAQQ